MEKLKSTKVSEIDVSKYSDKFDGGIVARVAHAIRREVPGAEIHIDESHMEVKQDQFFLPQEYIFTFQIRLTSKEKWSFCEKQTLVKKLMRRIETNK